MFAIRAVEPEYFMSRISSQPPESSHQSASRSLMLVSDNRLPMLISQRHDSSIELPPLPTAGCGVSVLSWADRFLRAYEQRTLHFADQDGVQRVAAETVAVEVAKVRRVLASLDQTEEEQWHRREVEAFEFTADHYDFLIASRAPQCLTDAFQLLMLLLLSVDQFRKRHAQTGVEFSFAGVEEVLNANRTIS